MNFVAVDGNGELLLEQGYETMEDAVEDATKNVKDNPDTEVEIFERVKVVSSTLTVDVKDAEPG